MVWSLFDNAETPNSTTGVIAARQLTKKSGFTNGSKFPLSFVCLNQGHSKHYFVTSESTNSSNNTVIVTKCGAEPSDIIGDNYFLK